MMRMKTKNTEMSSVNGSSGDGVVRSNEADWELRPGGMLVQKRNPDSDRSSGPAPKIKVRVKFGSSHHEINIIPQATFGELKKLLAALTGVHPQDQKLLFKDKERDSNAYLDMVGVKDKSKIILEEDPISHERRILEMRKNAKMENASKSISEISLEVDKLAGQVSDLENEISRGGEVAERDVLNLIELLMTQLLKLDEIMVDGDVKLQRRMQVKRVQKYVETLDLLKIRNSMPSSNVGQTPKNYQQGLPQLRRLPIPMQQQRHSTERMPPLQQQQEQPLRHSAAAKVAMTTKWETFDSIAAPPSTSTITTMDPPHKLNWEFFE